MKSRPYFNKHVDELEMIFRDNQENPDVLRLLLDELTHRRTPRARVLETKVQVALRRLSQTTPHPEKPNPPSKVDPSPTEPPSTPQSVPNDVGVGAEAQTATRGPEDDDPGSSGSGVIPPGVESLLAAWTTQEVLEPQPLPSPEDLKVMHRPMVRAQDHREPWTETRFDPRGRETEVYWFVHFGEIDLGAALASLTTLFPDDSPEGPARAKGKTTMAVAVLDGNGKPVEGKTFLSSFAWGYGKVRAGQVSALPDFPEEERRLRMELEARLRLMDEEGDILPVTGDVLEGTSRWLMQRLGLPAEEVSPDHVSVRVAFWRRQFEAPEPELLNSFYLEDLSRIRAAIQDHDVGSALRSFVCGQPSSPRRDVVREPEELARTLAPENIPLARWPVRGRYPLVMMQQAAVNHVLRELRTPGLVGVNGPPGTGKTTLLRDVVAKVALDRAVAMSRFDDPNEAFTHVAPISTRGRRGHLYRLDNSLLGHEIVVASSNNGAVENISREIPRLDAIADDFDPALRYFASVADQLAAEHGDDSPQQQCWGLAAGVLGNAANRRRFVNDFWWNEERGFGAYLRAIKDGWTPPADSRSEGGDDEERPPEIVLLERPPSGPEEARRRWSDARRHFLRCWQHASSLRRELCEAWDALHRRPEVEEALDRLANQLRFLATRTAQVATLAEAAAVEQQRAEAKERQAREDRTAALALRPGFISRLFYTRRFRNWRDQATATDARLQEASRHLQSAEARSESARQELTELQERAQRHQMERDELETELSRVKTVLAEARSSLGENFPDETFWSLPEGYRQRLSPWLSPDFQAARDALFEASFALHRAFIDAAAPRLRHNLGAAMQLLNGRSLSEKQEPARRSLWASLFLVVPVISTTFASFSRLFGPMGREQLGWLLIDEAGQAVPQAAAGAIWRSQRVIGIGDPMQIEPVVTLPQRLINAIFAQYSVDPDEWSAPSSSVQSLADRASWFGTTLHHEAGDSWVGSPLRVHRRCIEPMFSISNRIAYNGLMVQATPERESRIGGVLGESAWFDVPPGPPGHWSPQEAEEAACLLRTLLERLQALQPDVFFISPFRLVGSRLRERLAPELRGFRQIESPRSWVTDNVGTIHTFQGKQAEAVVLVLGASSPQNQGARYWAGGSPNLLNVAASRAKLRLYVLGNREAWRDAGVFRTLAASLPTRPMPWHR